MIVHFTIEAHAPFTSGRQGIRTLIPTSGNRLSRAARPTVPGYLPFLQWTHRELNADLQTASLMSSLWTMSPFLFSGPPGSRTPISWLQARRLPVGRAAHVFHEGRSAVAIGAGLQSKRRAVGPAARCCLFNNSRPALGTRPCAVLGCGSVRDSNPALLLTEGVCRQKHLQTNSSK